MKGSAWGYRRLQPARLPLQAPRAKVMVLGREPVPVMAQLPGPARVRYRLRVRCRLQSPTSRLLNGQSRMVYARLTNNTNI
jgi:hypothetical protein